MASRISQMRNGQIPQQPQLNQAAIDQTRAIMQQIKNSNNPQALLANMLQNNPNTAAIASMINNGGNLEQIARQMAQQKGIDINQLLSQLQGGI